jgi:hypothetical protein
LTLFQYCGICYEGASSTGRQYAQQPKPHGQTCLRSRSMISILVDFFTIEAYISE